MSERTLQCEDALRLLAAYLDGELEHADQIDLEHHLKTCRSCYSRTEFERLLKAQIGELRKAEPESEFVERIRGLIRRFAGETETKPLKP